MDIAWLTYLLRSKSLSFANNRKNKKHSLSTFYFNGKPLKYRAGTSDMSVIKEILLKRIENQNQKIENLIARMSALEAK
mgnify:CR=1 FL=1